MPVSATAVATVLRWVPAAPPPLCANPASRLTEGLGSAGTWSVTVSSTTRPAYSAGAAEQPASTTQHSAAASAKAVRWADENTWGSIGRDS